MTIVNAYARGKLCLRQPLSPCRETSLTAFGCRLARSETKRGDGCEEGFIVQLMAAAHAIMRLSPNEGGAITVTRNRMGRFLKGEGIAS